MTTSFAKEQLLQYITKIEKLEEEKSSISEDLKELMNDARNNGFDVKTLRQIVKIRKKDKDKLAEEEELLALYREALEL